MTPLYIKISTFQSSHYINVSMHPPGSGCKSFGICEPHFGNHCPGQSSNALVPMVPNTEVYQITLLSGQFTSFHNMWHTRVFIYEITYIKVSHYVHYGCWRAF